MTRTAAFLIATVSLTLGGATAGAAAPDCQLEPSVPPYQHVRISDPKLAAAFDEGLTRSVTLRRILSQVESFNALVYVRTIPSAAPVTAQLTGAMSHDVVRAGGFTFVRISVWPRRGNHPVATIAHELQHAIEVLRANVAGAGDVMALYTRIGVLVSAGIYETEAARDVGRAVQGQLAKCR